jgi:acetate kinase
LKILVINSGSSSIKYKLYFMETGLAAATGQIERIGQGMGRVEHTAHLPVGEGGDKTVAQDVAVADHKAGIALIMELLCGEAGVIGTHAEVSAVGHRVVHGGERFKEPALATDEVLGDIRAAIPLAPLHNPANLMGIEAAAALFPNAPQVAVFDTAFHQTMPPRSYVYALPYELYEKHGVRRYGFHGISHGYVSRQAAAFLGREIDGLNLITAHLGGGGSVCAIEKGKSVDTTMGMTPLSGTIMGTRCGDIDPEIEVFLEERAGYSVEQVDDMLNKKSGLYGICGSIDMRDIHARRKAGDARAQLAFDVYVHVVRKFIGGYMAELGHVDALVFTAGIGEHDPDVRREACKGLAAFGVVLGETANAAPTAGVRFISTPESRVAVIVAPTDEEFEIARQTKDILDFGRGRTR